MNTNPGLEPIKKEPLKTTLTRRLTQYIWNQMEDGDKLPTEKELSDQLQVGRSSIRETLRSIEAIGLLEVRRGSGYFVTKHTGNLIRGPIELIMSTENQSLEEIIEARLVFEDAIVDLIAERITDREIKDARQAIENIESSLKNQKSVLEWDQRFHQILYKASHNSVIYHIQDLVTQIIQNIPGSYLESDTYTKETQHYHSAILEALEARDAGKLRSSLKLHNEWIRKVFKS